MTEFDRDTEMFGKFLSHLLGSAGEDFEAADDSFEELMEFEEGGWVVVNLPGESWPQQRHIHESFTSR